TPAVSDCGQVRALPLQCRFMRPRSGLRNNVEYWLAQVVLKSLAWAPIPVAHRLARAYTGLLDLALPRLRRVALSNLAMALPELTRREHQRIASGVFASLARLLLTFSRFPSMRNKAEIGKWIRYEGFEHFEDARRRGRGVLFATAHLGNWE